MRYEELTSDSLFEESELQKLNENVENPQWSEPMELSDFLNKLGVSDEG